MDARARCTPVLALVLPALVACTGGCADATKAVDHSDRAAQWRAQNSWQMQESAALANQVQLTFPDRFVKAGEAYFSPDGTRIIFQAVEKPASGDEPYAMYVATLDGARGGQIKGLSDIRCISPPGSFNTCGWFDPVELDRVIFATTVTAPASRDAPGYQRGTRKYEWKFPPETDIYACRLGKDSKGAPALQPLLSTADSYQAECSLSPDGRHLLYCSLESGGGDIYVRDLKSGTSTLVVGAPGYDGGPFFSPDARRICWRSDRRGDDLLQLYVADVVYDTSGKITRLAGETQLTSNRHVNFAPFWHPDGRHLVYTTSEVGHSNYEVFLIDASPGGSGDRGKRRVTNVPGFDGFPAFSRDGKRMLWTSQREGGSSQVWVADFVLDPGATSG